MRISDWSSDVCSSDLDRQFPAMVGGRARLLCGLFLGLHAARARPRDLPADLGHPGISLHDARIRPRRPRGLCPRLLVGALCRDRADRKSVVEGKSVAVRLGLGGRRLIKKKKTNKT